MRVTKIVRPRLKENTSKLYKHKKILSLAHPHIRVHGL